MAIDSIGNADHPQSLLINTQRSAKSTNAQNRDKASTHSDQENERAEAVNLTTTAASLLAAEKALKDLPVVNTQKVEHIKQQIQSGQFEINSERTAEKMIAFENLLNSRLGDR